MQLYLSVSCRSPLLHDIRWSCLYCSSLHPQARAPHTQSTQAPKLFPTFPHPQNLFTSAQSLCLFLFPVIDALSPYIKPLCSPRCTDRNGVVETGLERPASRAPGWVGWLVGWRAERESGKGRRGAALASNCAASLATHLRWEPSVLAHAQIA